MNGRTFAQPAGDFKAVGVSLHIRQTHARAKAQITRFLAGSGKAFLQGLIDIGNPRPYVAGDQPNFLRRHFHDQLTALTVNDQV